MSKTRIINKKSDGGPMIFLIDIFQNETFLNPILPIPSRIDKIINGDISGLITPSEPISIKINEIEYSFNYEKLYQNIVKNLIHYALSKFKEVSFQPLKKKKIENWWNLLIQNEHKIKSYEEDLFVILQSYLEAYKSYRSGLKLEEALLLYCDSIITYCNKKIEQNVIKFNSRGKEKQFPMYKMNRGKLYPNICEYDILNYQKKHIFQKAFIPLLIYDDLLECFLFNKQILQLKLNPNLSFEEIGFSNQAELEEQLDFLNNSKLISFDYLINQDLLKKTEQNQDDSSNKKQIFLKDLLADISVDSIIQKE
ncbi:hypothetical protein DSAG12_03476 [Promethearchaeum syntrophicum]|uniref:Uncharacterized protein n=1 Tax=Promethearchaeum syntrophicum TaxID=2594042 RepID=A0A5B9DEA1_9ARCH|nr:hypothetical protein [Candidatus Prometheoarchaeum syntrophicum]